MDGQVPAVFGYPGGPKRLQEIGQALFDPQIPGIKQPL
jgi:hypothetical protein